jgi:hypothetical protein
MTQAELECFQQVGMAVVELSAEQRAAINSLASIAVLGGASDIYHCQAQRDENSQANQVTGAAGEAAFFLWAEALGSGGFRAWESAHRERYAARLNGGDSGVDCVLESGTRVDVKASACRQLTLGKALTMHLIAPGRIVPEVAYVLALMDLDGTSAPGQVVLAGWMPGSELEGRWENHGFAGPAARCRDTYGMGMLQ